jgi:integrase
MSPRRLRHTSATHLIRNGVGIQIVRQLLGHADLQTTARHLHSDTRRKLTAVWKLNGLLGNSGGEEKDTAAHGMPPQCPG